VLAEEIRVKKEGGEVDKKSALEKTARDLGISEDFEINKDENEKIETIEYNGNENKIKEIINSEINYNEVRNAGYIITTVDGKPYLSDIKVNGYTTETEGELLAKIGESYGYIYVPNGKKAENNKNVATGDILRKTGQEDITIIVKGDVGLEADGEITLADATQASRCIKGAYDSMKDFLAADINNDGRITRFDAMDIQKWYNGNPSSDGLTEEQAQKVTLKKVIELVQFVLYTSDERKTEIKEILATTYTNITNSKITLPAGTTAAQFQAEVKKLITDASVEFEIYDETEENEITGTDTPLVSGYIIYMDVGKVDTETADIPKVSFEWEVQ